MKFKALLITILGLLALLTGAGYWYVFIIGAPQIDAPPTKAKDPQLKLSFAVQTFDSKAMGTERKYGLILPPDYNQNPNKRYPVIFLLHGGHDDENAWVKKIGIIPVLEELYKSKKLPYSIVVTPDGNDQRGTSPLFDPQYYDGPNGKVGTLIGSELPQVIKSRYRALDSAQFWAIGGLSSGGWGAYNIGLQHLENFNILFSHMGYFTDKSGSENSPEEIVKTLTPEQRKKIRMYFDTGKDDLEGPEFMESSKKFHEILNQLGIENEFNIFPGGHGVSGPDFGWNYNNKHSRDSLTYVGKQFNAGLAQLKKT